MKVLVLGASGVIGQHMRLSVPSGITPIWHRCGSDDLHISADLTDEREFQALLKATQPDVIINLAGESNTDEVENASDVAHGINVRVPVQLALWCDANNAHLIHCSTQAVFDGEMPPYSAESGTGPINQYGRQKDMAEMHLWQFRNWIIVRPTFVIGVRPMPTLGRRNPVEAMLAGQGAQVSDRYFSPLYARDAAELLWQIAIERPNKKILHLGEPVATSRYAIATELGVAAVPVSHDSFEGIAPRPRNTTYDTDALYKTPLPAACYRISQEWQERQNMTIEDRAREIAIFLGTTEDAAITRLRRGFSAAHNDVAADFRAANPRNDAALLEWYRQTESYIWELSIYHSDPGWNYSGMCAGFLERLKAEGLQRVLVLGDGIGDLTLALRRGGIDAVYHDLAGSRTAEFAKFRYWRHTGEELPTACTSGWMPEISYGWDAILSLDFLEHVTDVEVWAKAIRDGLNPNGRFACQNAFGIGSGDQGSIPCHLERNDRFEKDWTPLMASLGFEAAGGGNWWRIESEVPVGAV